MLQAACARGLSVKQAGVDEIVLRGGRAAGVKVGDAVIATANVVIAGGAWSSAFERQLGVRIPVEPQRGQLVHLRVFESDTTEWPIVENFRGHYVVPWPDGRVVAGATRETGAGFDAIATVAGLRQVLDEAFRLLPALAQAEIVEMRVGLRPLCVDRLPVLGRIPDVEGVFLATGHGSTGLQLGPYSAKLVAALLLGENLPIDLRPFEVTRFAPCE
jgi:D-amino-acid dehydrogenase